MAKEDFEDFLSRITFAESRGKRTDSSGKLLEGPMTKYGTAKGELQVLDSTNKKPGYGIVPAKDDTPDERARVGRDYLKAMLDKFKDKRTAAIAYNWGPGNTQKWLDAGADEAGLPLETQNYVKKVMGTEVAKAPAPLDMAPAPRQAAGAPSVPGAPANRPIVSRETVGPGTKETTVGVGPGTQGTQAEDRLSALGPSYQAAMALSYLADTTNPAPQEEDEDGELRISGDEPRSTAREDDEATKFLMEPSARTALADFDFKIQSPFAERPVKRMSGGGDPELTQEEIDAASRPSFGNPNMARQAAKTRSLQAARSNDVNTLPDPQTYAFTQGMLGEAPDQLGFSPTHPDYKKIIGRGEQGMVTGGVSMIGPAAKALKGLVGMGAKTLKPAASAAEISKDFLQRQKAGSSGPDGAARMAVAQRNAALPIEQGGLGLPANNTAMDRAAAMGFDTDVFHGTSKDFLTFNPDKEVFAAELPEIANLYGKYRKGEGQRIMPLKIRGKQLTISDMDDAGKNNQFGYNLAKKLNLSDDEIEKLLIPQVRYPNGELIPGVKNSTTTFSDLGEREIINRLPKHGIDRLKVIDMDDMGGQQTQYMLPAGSDNVRSSFAAYDPFRRTAAVAAAMGAAAPDLLAGQEEKKEVNRAKGSPEEGEVSQEELDAASKPSFKAQSSGMNRQRGPISDALASGEAYTAAAKGLTEMPYNLAGGAMDLAMMVRQGLTGQAPAGQVGTSDYIKNKMTEFGIRQAPPTDPTLKGFYELGDLGSNLVNPAAPVRGAVKAAEKTGEAAKMLAKTIAEAKPGPAFGSRAAQLGIVRPSGGLFPATKPADATAAGFEPISRIDDVFVELRKSIENKTDGNVESREASLKFVNNKLLDYFRTKAGSVGDPVREALITGKIKIPKNSQLEEDFPQALIDAAQKGDVTAMVAIERKLDKDLNIKSFRKKQDNESVQKTEEESQKFTNFILQQMQESPGNIPDSLLLRLAKKDDSKMSSEEATALVKKMRQEMADNPNYFSLRLEPSIQRMITKDPDFKLESATGSDIQKYGNNIFKALKEAEKTKEGIMALSNDMPITDFTYRYPAFTLLGINSNDLPKIITKINPEELGRMGVPEFLNEAIKIKTKINEFEKIKNTLEKLINKNNFNFPKEISLYGTQPFLETSKGFTWREVIDPDAAALQGQMMDNSIGGYSRSGTYGAVRNGRAALEKKDVRIFSLYGPENTPLVNAEYITPSYVRKIDPSTGDPTGPVPNSLHQITGNGTRTKNAEPKDYGLPIFELMEKLGTDKIPYNIGAIVNPLPAPPSVIQLRAQGGFMERQSNDNRKYL